MFYLSNLSKSREKKRIAFTPLSLAIVIAMILLQPFPSACAQDYVARNLTVDLGDGLVTDAELTLPGAGDGPFPAVLLIQGSGPIDMNEYLPPEITGSHEPSRPFLQIAEYLSGKGFAVLRFNKRGVGLNSTILNASVVSNATYQSYRSDAQKSLQVLRAQPEVDKENITLLGHSEGAIVAPRIAREDKEIKNIVLMSAPAGNLRNNLEFQLLRRPIFYAEEVIDKNRDGLLSIEEVEAIMAMPAENLAPLPSAGLVVWNNTTEEYQWHSIITSEPRGPVSIKDDLEPLIVMQVGLLLSDEAVQSNPWFSSYFALNNTTDIIGDISASILILQGENDTQIPVQEAIMLDRRLEETGHPDHTLIIYPGLGHTFYPAKNWIQPLGPVEEIVLADLYSWLTGVRPEGNESRVLRA